LLGRWGGVENERKRAKKPAKGESIGGDPMGEDHGKAKPKQGRKLLPYGKTLAGHSMVGRKNRTGGL